MADDDRKKPDSRSWAPYAPDRDAPWNVRRVMHLHRRAGFGASWQEIQRDIKDGPKASIDRVLAGTARAGVPKEFEQTAATLAENAVAIGDPGRLKAWWLYRMIAGPDPLAERLTLLWHNHFATSNDKIRNMASMLRQNELFRQNGRGNLESSSRRSCTIRRCSSGSTRRATKEGRRMRTWLGNSWNSSLWGLGTIPRRM